MRALHLGFCVLADISSIGALVNFEVLSLCGSKFEELPREIGCLQHLKLLDIACCEFNGIVPGVLSSLTRLEELYMRYTFTKWSPVQKDLEKISASLAELIRLDDHLKVLDFGPQELHWFLEVEGFTNSNLSGELPFSLLENLRLKDMKLIKALCHPDFLQEAATRQMQLESNIVVELQLFHNLKLLQLEGCYEINHVFGTSLARGSLPQLQRLSVIECPEMEGIVYKETGENGQNIADMKTMVFPKLRVLELDTLYVLTSLYRAMDDNSSVQLCPSRNDIHMTPKVPESPNVLVPFKILKWLTSLELLRLSSCSQARVVFDFHGLMVMPLPEKEKANNSELIGDDDKDDDHFHGIDHRYGCLKCLPPLARKHKSVKGNNNNNTAQKKSQDDQIIATSSHPDSQGEVRDHRVTEKVLYNEKDLEVEGCFSLAVIFNFGEGHGSSPPVLNKLRHLKLDYLNGLTFGTLKIVHSR
ncbi:hypothetical protein FNV43_RR10539 [Rhamnella rubrinervis]|uniref:Disease resistance protein At4g27190-like leucine-rich repeats domain-containing protein n=1 Tax=Rhamnella rubrinervis TaxID=2594499 RepID=A0A8K0H4J5_9ROSA|nr:hypothetical protein FNV43_RR10539 [Rhamnella rubrinervis]